MFARIRDFYRAYVRTAERLLDSLEKPFVSLFTAATTRIPNFQVSDSAFRAIVAVVGLALFLFGLWGLATTLREAIDSGVGLFGPAPLPHTPRRTRVWLILLDYTIPLTLGAATLLWHFRERGKSRGVEVQP